MGTWKKLAYADDVILKALLTEQGDIIYASAASTPAALPHGTSSQYLKSGGDAANPSWDTPAGGGPTIVRKDADQIVNNSTVLVNDLILKLAVAANEVWEFTLIIYCDLLAASDFKHTFTVPAGATGKWWDIYQYYAAISSANKLLLGTAFGTSAFMATTANRIAGFFQIWGLIINGGTAGNLQYQWAQNLAAVEDTKVYKNSCLILHQLA